MEGRECTELEETEKRTTKAVILAAGAHNVYKQYRKCGSFTHLANSFTSNSTITYISVYFPLLESKLQVLHKSILREFVQENEVRLPVLQRAECSHDVRPHTTLRPLVPCLAVLKQR